MIRLKQTAVDSVNILACAETLGRQNHQLINDSAKDLILYVVADNPFGESNYFPDSQKWIVRSPERRAIRSDALDYYDGEE